MPQETPDHIIQISKKKVLWWIVGVVVVIVLALLVLRGFSGNMRMRSMSVGDSISSDISSMDMGGGYSGMKTVRESVNSMPPMYDGDYYGGGTPSISDTREFIKTNYSATLRTRNVSDAVEESEDAIRRVSGRIDNRQNSEKYGYIRFVVPKDRFYEFKDMIEEIVPGKLYTENISSQNLLGQKQNIEENFSITQSSLADLEALRKTRVSEFTKNVTGYAAQKSSEYRAQLTSIESRTALAKSDAERSALATEESIVRQNMLSLEKYVEEKTRQHNNILRDLDAQIANAKANVDAVVDQDIAFGENIETVDGYINVQWISVWNILRAFSPIRPGWIVFILVTIALLVFRKMRWLPKIELV